MKNTLLSVFILLSSYLFSQSCTHTIQRTDTWGDGWNGGLVSVSVNGVTVLTGLSCTGAGPTSSNFTATAGQIIRVWRTAAGSYPYEMRIRVISSSGAVVINTIEPVSGTSSSGGRVGTATCGAPPPPSNDLVCNSTFISCGQTLSGTTVNATNSGTGEGGFCSVSQTQPGVWYVIPGNGQIMTANLCATAWDSKISVFSGVGCGSLTCIGGNDDFGPACASSSASFSWSSVVGTNYYILVHGYSANSSFSINVTCVAPPAPGPCINTIAYGTQSLPVFGGISYTTIACQFAGEYSTWAGAVSGTPYIAMTTVATDWVTVRSGTYNGAVVAVGLVPLSFTPTNNNTLFIHVNTNSLCGTSNTCRDVSVTRMSALPVELISFTGKKQINSNMLYWSTASEYNTSHFIIEKSDDGVEWIGIGQVQSAGNSTQRLDYSLEDKDVSQVINYYRLHQYDIDGVDDIFGPIAINNRDRINIIAKRINLAGQEVNENATGIIIEIYEDGTIKRIIK